MPRRNHKPRRKAQKVDPQVIANDSGNYVAMARRLVAQGKASQRILGVLPRPVGTASDDRNPIGSERTTA